MRGLSQGDFLGRLRHAGIVGQVRASQVKEAFRLYVASEFPDVPANTIEPLYVREGCLVIRCTSAAATQQLHNQGEELCHYLSLATGMTITKMAFRP